MFELDERLANDTVLVGELPLSRVLLMKDSRFPRAILAPRRKGLAEFHDLPPEDRLPAAMKLLGIDFSNLSEEAGHA